MIYVARAFREFEQKASFTTELRSQLEEFIKLVVKTDIDEITLLEYENEEDNNPNIRGLYKINNIWYKRLDL